MTAATRRIVLPGEPLRDGPTTLRPWRDTDAEPLAQLARDPTIARFTRVPPCYGISDARSYLRTRIDFSHAGLSASFAVTAAVDGALLGSISLMHLAWSDRRGEVGYWLGAPARGRGHATRAVTSICAWGMRTLGLERIELLAAVENRRSQAVARRAGFTEEATLRSAFAPGDGSGRQDMICFGLLSTDVPGHCPGTANLGISKASDR